MRRAIPWQLQKTLRAPFTVRPSSGASARPVKVSGFSPSGISLGLGVAKLAGGSWCALVLPLLCAFGRLHPIYAGDGKAAGPVGCARGRPRSRRFPAQCQGVQAGREGWRAVAGQAGKGGAV